MNEALIDSLKQDYEALLAAGDLAAAVPLIRQAANWGDLFSQKLAADLFLGRAFNHPVSWTAAIEYLQMAALNEDAQAMKDLADVYDQGPAAVRSRPKAFYWMNKAAHMGCQSAWDPLGMMYLQGISTERNLNKARSCFEKAEAAGDLKAKAHLRLCALKQQKNT